MSTITREWLQQAINDYESVRDELPFGLDDYQGNILAALRIALASLEAEPVAWKVTFTQIDREYNTFTGMYSDKAEVERWVRLHKACNFRADITPLYTAKPVPVSVPLAIHDDDFEKALSVLNDTLDDCGDSERGLLLALDKAGIEVRSDACRAAMLQSGNFRENKNSSTNNFREIAETSTNYPVIPSEVLSAILKVAKIRADFDDFDGDRRGIGDCLDEAEQELIVTINKYASQLAAEPIATNDVREQTAVPPVPVIQADVAQAIEKLKRKLVECNRYNYCADAVKGVEYACHAAMLHGAEPVSQTYKLNELSGNSPVTPDGWIPVSERMPEPYEYVLVTDGFDGCEVMRVNTDGYWGPAKSLYPGSITHWMPLPEPPRLKEL